MIRTAIYSLMFVGALFAEGRIDGPAIGLLFDETAGQLRIAEGIPGAAILSQPVASMRAAAVSAQVAVGISGDSVAVYHLRTRTAQNIDGAALPDRIAVSPSGTAAALVSGQRVQIIKNLSDSPVIDREFEIPERAGVLAVSDDGAELLWSLGGALYRNSDRFASSRFISTIDFFPGSHDAVIVDREDAKLMLLRDGSFSVLAQAEGLVAAAAGNGVVHAVVKGKIASFMLDGTLKSELECNCGASTVDRLAENIFRLTRAGAGPTWIFDASAEGRIVFVPGGGNE